LDPLTNPAEMGWPSLSELREKLRTNVQAMRQFKTAFPQDKIWATDDQMSKALVAFLGTLKTGDSEFDKASAKREPLPPEAELGRRLFTGIAQCSQCHTIDESNSRFTDEKFHHSGIGNASQLEALPKLAFTVTQTHLNESQLGPKVLTDREWSLLGRFVVSLHPEDIGAFRTPSLRNVAVTAPYMHDGSIATLAEAVDHEVYYRGFSSGRPINLSDVERRALVAFLKTLTNSEYLAGPAK
jgi:cytochrome c peroxidase